MFFGENFRHSWKTSAASPSLPARPQRSANSFNHGCLQGKRASLLPTQPGQNEPPYLLREERGGVPKFPFPLRCRVGLLCHAGLQRGLSSSDDVSALTRSGGSDDRDRGRREESWPGREGGEDEGEEGCRDTSSPGPPHHPHALAEHPQGGKGLDETGISQSLLRHCSARGSGRGRWALRVSVGREREGEQEKKC